MRKNQNLSCLLFIIFFFSFFAEAQPTKRDLKNPFISKLNSTIPDLLKNGQTTGLAIGLIEDGKVLFTQGYGFADVEAKRPLAANTIMPVGSISKPITAWGVMHLVYKGKFRLDDPVDLLLKSWKLPKSDFDNNEVTIRRLLSHTAGTSVFSAPWFQQNERRPSLIEVLNGTVGDRGMVKVIKKPGSVWSYSGGGYTILELLIEDITLQSFNDYMISKIFQPLGMKDTSFLIDYKKPNPRAAKLYDEGGKLVPSYQTIGESAGNLQTTANDFVKILLEYCKIHQGKVKPKLLNSELIKTMLTKVAEVNLKDVGAEIDGAFYGLGHGIHRTGSGDLIAYHSGGNPGVRAYFLVSPEKGNGIILISNSENGVDVIKKVLQLWSQNYKVDLQPIF